MLSKKTQYAFQALSYMAQQPGNEPLLIAEIAKKKDPVEVPGKHSFAVTQRRHPRK
jgi:DNA-binding IscR family transcriptional regulator